MYEFLDFLAASHRTQSGRSGSALIWDEYHTNPLLEDKKEIGQDSGISTG
jgi:hypothetical protein